MLNVVPRDQQREEHAGGGKQRRGKHRDGRGEVAEFEQQHHEHQHHRQRQHEDQIVERFLLLLVLSAVLHADAGRQLQIRRRPAAPSAMPSPRLMPSKRPVTATSRCRFSRRISVCPGSSINVASEPSVAVLPVPLMISVLRMASSDLRALLREAHADGVGAVVHHHRRVAPARPAEWRWRPVRFPAA